MKAPLIWISLLLLAMPAFAGEPGKPCVGGVVMLPLPNDGWKLKSPRDEIAIESRFDEDQQAFHLTSADKEGLNGFLEKTFPVEGGKHFAREAPVWKAE